jgi:prepilin-type N-terminal cleavage/methylation domain-containing protein
MKINRKPKNDKGISLIEIIVAIAVGSIVLASVIMLVVQGVKSYRTQSTLANLQNDANIALNQMSDNIMEGTCLHICNLLNADGETYTSYFQIKENVYYVYDPDEKTIYQSQSSKKDTTSSVLCENVDKFSVHILDYNIIVGEDNEIEGITNPIQLKVDIEVAKLGESREADRTISIRNDMSYIELQVDSSVEDETEGSVSDKTANINIIGYDISSLKNYITSDN